MLRSHKFLVFLILSGFFSINSHAQSGASSGYVRLRIYGFAESTVKIDANPAFFANDTLLFIPVGNHVLKLWTPTAELTDSVITVKAHDTARYSFSMKHKKAYLSYKVEYSNYKSVQNR